MEIPTKDIIEGLDKLATKIIANREPVLAVLDAMDLIKAQALEIRELQAVIVRLRNGE
jgi:hypothetical protein